MYKYINECVAYCLKGKLKKCSINLIFLRFFKFIELLYLISVSYLLIFDTTFIVKIGHYNNKYMAALIWFFAIIIGLALHLCSMWTDYSLKKNIITKFNFFENNYVTINFLIKLILLRFYGYIIKLITMFLFLLPALIFQAVFFNVLQAGVSTTIFIICLISCVLSFFIGFITGLLLCQQYNLVEYCACLDQNKNISECVKYSKYLMDSKCKKLLKLKIRNIPYLILGIIFPNFCIIAKAREFFLMTDKTIEYARKMHTQQKAIVFYCKNVTA